MSTANLTVIFTEVEVEVEVKREGVFFKVGRKIQVNDDVLKL